MNIIPMDQMNKTILNSPVGPLPVSFVDSTGGFRFYCAQSLISNKTNDKDTS